MLAERKRKEKWSDDPRNTRWTRDKSKFGYRMLEKMGWKEGKGLGVQEDGSVNVIMVKKKDSNLGVGARHKHEDNWLENQAAFDDLLTTLNTSSTTSNETETTGKVSLQQLSLSSRKRIHYKRFTQSKDLSLASSHDVDSILGRRRKKGETHESSSQDDMVAACDDLPSVGVPTVSSDIHSDVYFQQKLAAKGLTYGVVAKGKNGQQERKKQKMKRDQRIQ